jgi:hypothetical protein
MAPYKQSITFVAIVSCSEKKNQMREDKRNFKGWLVFGFMVLNATFNNISVISWRSVL